MLESPSRIEPAGMEERIPENIVELTLALSSVASQVGGGLHPSLIAEIRKVMQVMNSYYSNLIEGHKTKPRDIEAALAGRGADTENRNLAEEAAAHVRVQAWIDDLADSGKLPQPTSVAFIKEVHRRFYEGVPAELLIIEGVKIIPGSFRATGQEVEVGLHLPPSGERIEGFMEYYENRYKGLTRGVSGRIHAIPAAHHRLAYIHPFIDGNGRVSRLVSHAMFRASDAGGHGLWSISRGLARGLREPSEYKMRLAMADHSRKGDRDGRGNLSMQALENFSAWFLAVALDQVRFSNQMLLTGELRARYATLVPVMTDDTRVGKLVDTIFREGEMDRGDAGLVLRTGERTARNVLSEAIRLGLLTSDTPKSAVRVTFPIDHRERLFPNLFTDVAIPEVQPPRAEDGYSPSAL